MARKTPGPKGPTTPTTPRRKVTLKITIDEETAKLLRHESIERGCTVGHVVTTLLGSSASRLVVSRRTRGEPGPPAPEAAPVDPAPGAIGAESPQEPATALRLLEAAG